MNQRENFFAMLNGEKPEYVPCFGLYNKSCFMPTDPESPVMFGGVDGFGINWVLTKEGAVPEPGKFLFEEMEDWKEFVKFPDVDVVDYEATAAIELADFNRDEQVLYILNGVVGMFTRMTALMGFENALIALVSDPDSCREFGEALADYEIKRVDKYIDAYKPDVIWYIDDVAQARSLFMSPEVYRSVIKPSSQRIIEHVTSRNVIVAHHCCGKCEDVIGDFVEMGCRIWSAAQIVNDIEGLQKKYGSRIIIEGGWDYQGKPGCIDATEQELCDEVVRRIEMYGKYGSFILLPSVFNEKGNSINVGDSRLPAMFDTYNRVCALA